MEMSHKWRRRARGKRDRNHMERCQSGRSCTLGKGVYPLKGTGGSNPPLSAIWLAKYSRSEYFKRQNNKESWIRIEEFAESKRKPIEFGFRLRAVSCRYEVPKGTNPPLSARKSNPPLRPQAVLDPPFDSRNVIYSFSISFLRRFFRPSILPRENHLQRE